MRLVRDLWARLCRHPRVSAIVVTVLVFFASLVPDLFLAYIWPYTRPHTWILLAFLLALAVIRLFRVRPGDHIEPPEPARGVYDRGLAWVLLGVCAALVIPLLRHPEDLGLGDWDLFLGKLEGARRTILFWGQFPWWDPWTRGGFPLAANPQCGVAGVAMPLALVFGTTIGMRLATVIGFALATEGARRLARLWLDDPWAAALAGLIYGINGAVLVAAVAAYHVTMSYPVLPWMLYCLFQLDRRPAYGIGLGFWLAFDLLNGIHYLSVYQPLIGALVWLRVFRVRTGGARYRLFLHSVVALGVFLALSGWRLATTGLVMLDFPRQLPSSFSEPFWSILRDLLGRPSAEDIQRLGGIPYFWETSCYIGPMVFALAVASLWWGWRWWHWLTLFCAWLAMGAVRWYDLSYWLQNLPLFSTMHAVSRWRFMALLGVALAAASVVAHWRRSENLVLRRLALAVVLAIAADYVSLGWAILPIAFSVPPAEAGYPGPPLPRGEIVQVQAAPGLASISRGYGVIWGYEPLLGYNRDAPTTRLWRGHPDYMGEHWTARGPVAPLFWSPNRIVLQVRPHETVFINQNPGSWWYVNGRPAFPGLRCAETTRVFAVLADHRGRVELTIRPRGLALGWGLQALGLVLAIAAGRLFGRKGCTKSVSSV